MEVTVLIIFILVYIGMALGNLPGLALDRTGIALLGAIAFIELKNLSLKDAVSDIDISSIAILFSFMIISAQLYYSGFYTFVSDRVQKWDISPHYFLLVIILIAGVLSAVLINDIVCLAMAPLLIRMCSLKKFNPVPFLIGLACGSNIGSALTLVGNPQNMLIGQVLRIPFALYTLDAIVPVILGWLAAWWIIKYQTEEWHEKDSIIQCESPAFDSWQSSKGVAVVIIIISIFLLVDVPREHVALTAAGLLLLSRQMATRMMLSFIDWQLLVLFIGLFIVNHEFNHSAIMQSFLITLQNHNIDISAPAPLFIISAVLSNIISNVPAVMLLLPFAKSNVDGTLLALSSTLAGNMFIVGSIANIIVVTQASNFGIRISWKKHLASGLPITVITLGLTAFWMYLRYFLV